MDRDALSRLVSSIGRFLTPEQAITAAATGEARHGSPQGLRESQESGDQSLLPREGPQRLTNSGHQPCASFVGDYRVAGCGGGCEQVSDLERAMISINRAEHFADHSQRAAAVGRPRLSRIRPAGRCPRRRLPQRRGGRTLWNCATSAPRRRSPPRCPARSHRGRRRISRRSRR